MGKGRVTAGLVAGCLVAWGQASTAVAAPTPAQVLGFQPRQAGINYTTPSSEEQAGCRVELVKNPRKGSGWLLRDAQNRPLRFFNDTDDDNRIDIWSYYHDGVEVYREVDTNSNGKPDQYRWLNSAGMKWGVDENDDGKIDGWKAISAEEVSQEIVQAIVQQDFRRFEALLISEPELKALNLPAAELQRIEEKRKAARGRFDAAVAKLAHLSEKTRWLHLETPVPQCLPADQTGAKVDAFRYSQGTILVETGGKTEWLQTGEMIQVGFAWRLTGGPGVGVATEGNEATTVVDADLRKLLDQLNEIDSKAPQGSLTPTANAEVMKYNLERADLIERIVAKVKPTERELWIRQVADCLSAAAQASPADDRSSLERLGRLREQVAKAMPASGLAAYVHFRELSAGYAIRLAAGKDFDKVQADWVDSLARFVESYPKADDSADALLQLGMVCEFLGKEAEARKWYQQLLRSFPDRPVSAKGEGALRRLEIEGKTIEMEGKLLGKEAAFDIAALKGKVVAIYYWASWNQQCVGDFAKLKLLLESYGGKGFELLCVNLDSNPEEAMEFLQKSSAPGTHLFQPGGMDSPLATRYGVMVLPHLFLVGKDGKVVSRTIQIGNLEDEVKKRVE